jgi:hypothetical protein
VISEDKDQVQTKKLIQCMHQGVSSLVSQYNKTIDEMTTLCEGGKAPCGARLPRHLQMDKLFHIDVVDDIWKNDGLGGLDADELAPQWLAVDTVCKAIASFLEQDRCDEESKHIRVEIVAM